MDRIYSTIIVCCFITAFVCVFPQQDASAQTSFEIQGRLLEAGSLEPLPGANVYLANTLLGASTDSAGNYHILNIPPGIYRLTFSFIGYETYRKEIILEGKPETHRVTAFLKPEPRRLDSLVVESERPAAWLEMKNQFEKQFLGFSRNASESTIENAEILEFDLSDNGILSATAGGPLQIRNQELGYRLYVELESFRWNLQTGLGNYVIYPRFTKMEASSEDQENKWEANREDTYLGSLKHFLAALYHGTAEDAGFNFSSRAIRELDEAEVNQVLGTVRKLPQAMIDTLKGYQLEREMRIDYDSPAEVSRSMVSPSEHNRNRVFFMDRWGNLLDPRSISVSGAWASDRVADMLPLHYTVPE